MPCAEMNSKGFRPTVKIAVVCTQAIEPRVREIITFNVPSWRDLHEIEIVGIPTQWKGFKREVLRRVDLFAPKTDGPVHVLVLDDLLSKNDIGVEDGDDRKVSRIPSITGLVQKLPSFLEAVHLDWITLAEQKISKWHHGTVDRSSINRWLEQFDELGSNRWIGEGLLKSFDFWDEQRVIQTADLTLEALQSFDRVCMHRQQPGKSSDALCNLFTKQIKSLDPKFLGIGDLYDVLNNPQPSTNGGRILFVEDGLFSGTEMTKLLGDMLGLPIPEGRNRKSPPLKDVSLLRHRKLHLLFPVATTLGIARLDYFLKQNNLPNVEVTPCNPGLIDVLTPLGREALANGTIDDLKIRNCPADPDAHLFRLPFQSLSIWKDTDRIFRATHFCKEVGWQLYQGYLESVGYKWDPDKTKRCALGMFGIGLALAFSHSVPKATLPLFWFGGKVKVQDRQVNWVPLFQNA
jgi:hypothetical protein